MRIFFLLIAILSAAVNAEAQQPVGGAFLSYFTPIPAFDTLRIETSEKPEGAEIPNDVFFSTVPKPFLQEIDYLADSAEATVFAQGRFAINDSISVCWVEIRQFWFQHQSLLLYNAKQNAIVQRITVAEWYGGDGGQILIGSWLFDFDDDGKKDIVVREIQHATIPDGDNVLERQDASATLFLWSKNEFKITPVADMSELARRYPIQNPW